MSRILGRSRRSRWLRSGIGIFACTVLIGLFAIPNAFAVHDIGVFELDENAITNDATPPPEDWDLICKAHQPSSTPAGECIKSPAYTFPTATTTANPSSFRVDPSESSQDDILKGGTKDDNAVGSWKWASAKPSPPKNDITHGFAAEYVCRAAAGCDTSGLTDEGDKLLYFGADRFSNSGSANIAFWFFQDEIKKNPATGTCSAGAGCPFTGAHTEGDVSLGGSTPGDILIISAFGPHAEINIYEWVGPGNATSPCFTNACTLEPLLENGDACEDVTNDAACATVNEQVVQSPWTVNQKNAPANSFQPTNFFEGGLNLSALGVDACFSSFLINTRASAAGDAELHDMILGQFERCAANMTTDASTSVGQTVTPGTAVTDTANFTVSGSSNPDDPTGTVTFFLCNVVAPATDCSTGGTNIGTGTIVDSSSPANTTDGIAKATSPTVNDSAQTGARGSLAPGRYCFRAEWPGDANYDDPLSFTNSTDECFDVAKIPAPTVTTPGTVVNDVFTPVTSVSIGTTVFDRAVVTGTSAGGDPTGEVNFFICTPGQLTPPNTGTCTTGGTALAGNPKTLVSDGNPATFTSSALSGGHLTATVGKHCFRAAYGGSTVYDGSSDSSEGECFTVTASSSGSSVQKWLPNDSVTINSGVPLNGTLSITLRTGSCTGTVIYTEPTNQTLSNVASGTTFNTTNTGTFVNEANQATPYFWRAVYTPTSSFVTGVTICERTDITIDDTP